MSVESTCVTKNCGRPVPPGEKLCQGCGTKVAIAKLTQRNNELEKEIARLNYVIESLRL